MSSSFNLNFSYQDTTYNLKLVQNDKPSDYSVRINGISYTILGEAEKLPMAYKILSSISLTAVDLEKDLLKRIEDWTKTASLPETAKALSILIPTAPINSEKLAEDSARATPLPETTKTTPALTSSASVSNEIVKGSEGAAIDRYLSALTKVTPFSGAVRVVKGGETILSKGYGNATKTEKNTASTVFHIGSLTKQFTAAAIMKLVENGVIDVKEKINKYLPDRYQSKVWKDTTVEQLLSHTSGLSDYIDDDPTYFDNCLKLDRDKLIRQAMEEPLKYKVGEFRYSNTGYLLLGAMIEEQSKVSYGEFMEREFFGPAKMSHTHVHDTTFKLQSNMAIGFCPDKSGEKLVEDVREDLSKTCGADGNIYSSLEDLVKWSHILDAGGKILKKESLDKMKTPVKAGYGYGMQIDKSMGTTRIAHNGLVPGFTSSFVKYPDQDMCLVVLCNNGTFPADFITDYMSELLLDKKGEKLTLVPHNFKEDPRLGTFKSVEGTVQMEFFEKDGHLFMKGIDGPETSTECLLLSNQCIFHPKKGLKIEFKNDTITVYADRAITTENPTGKVDQLVRTKK